ncbi:MAG: hypothetical protein R3E45_07185 [Rhodocyclaceae bacterium]
MVTMLSVEAPQQVMLEVKVAEVSKTLCSISSARRLPGAFEWLGLGLAAQ